MRHDDCRRDFLLRTLALGAFAVSPTARAETAGDAAKSIHSLKGELRVNGRAATAATRIGGKDVVQTGADSQVIFVVGKDAFILRPKSELHLSGDKFLVKGLRLVSGALLSAFGKGPHDIITPTATIGIRGTGIYVEAQADRSYVCNCYGTTVIAAAADPAAAETVVSKHHNARYVTADGKLRTAPFLRHDDDELMLIESLLGRTPPFAAPGDGRPKR